MKTFQKFLYISVVLYFCSNSFAGNLVGHWKLDETSGATAYDSAGTNTGTVSGALWTDGKVGGALRFDGVDDSVIIPDSEVLTPANAMTLSYWPYTSGTQEAGVYKFAPGGTRSYVLHTRTTNTARLIIYSAPIVYDSIETVSTVPLNSWHLITATFDSGLAKIYIDGKLDNSKTMSVSTIANDIQPLTFGGHWDYLSGSWSARLDGMIDDVRLYDYALSNQEVSSLVPEPATFCLMMSGLMLRRK